ncbi:MAG TPA: SsrA-binding protein SmpB [Victivallales bacterium]|nr:SsrA-binding protein SmpB [Victivallales bacterium]HRR29562.1 SsrA-binding protein SmpB [Victivallales bacterium]HRU00650.1 SsrA-binding protein SmpB [Victivallales bacterium]
MTKLLIENKKARHDYHILEVFEAGIELKGTEVKSCKLKNISLNEAFAKVEKGEVKLYGCHIAKYNMGTHTNHEPTRPRRLLLHKPQIRKMAQALMQKGLTLIPLNFHIRNGFIKVDLAIAKGKTQFDKREKLKKEEDRKTIKKLMSAKRK